MQRTRAQRFAVGAFNIDNQETLIAVARAAQKLQSPVLVEVSDAEVKAMGLETSVIWLTIIRLSTELKCI